MALAIVSKILSAHCEAQLQKHFWWEIQICSFLEKSICLKKHTKDFMVQFVVMLNGTRLKRLQVLGSVLLLEALVAIPKHQAVPGLHQSVRRPPESSLQGDLEHC